MPDVADPGSVRRWMTDTLAPLLPTTWKIVPSVRNVDKLDRVLVQFKHTGIARMAEAPIGHLQHTVTVTIVSPRTDTQLAEDQLDVALTELLAAIDGTELISWDDATKVTVDNLIGWDVDVLVLSSRTPTPTEDPEGD